MQAWTESNDPNDSTKLPKTSRHTCMGLIPASFKAHNSISTGWVPHTMNNQAAIWGWQQGNLSDQHALVPKEIESHGAN